MSDQLDIPRLKELCAKAMPGPWETINHETTCPNFGYCSPNGCPGHESNTAYDVNGPMLLRDGEVSGESEEEDRQQFQQADHDAKFIAAARTALPALIAANERLEAELAERPRLTREQIREAIYRGASWANDGSIEDEIMKLLEGE